MSEPTTTLLIEWNYDDDDVSEITEGDVDDIDYYDYNYYVICQITSTMEQCLPISEDRTTTLLVRIRK